MKKFKFPSLVRNRFMDNFDTDLLEKVQTNVAERSTFTYGIKDLLFQVV